ncbi:hypothetical protein JOC28_001647 [Streptococcus loxodontisalivarius]|uniref:Uncharacterized protein n=1 Tax=Streptococcus loxodontisalivarius TaxID=1349415 RepID=A0ABS2PUH9_9STRE|nr:hypothetical protein [Streptococcus loxodontisalivarius]
MLFSVSTKKIEADLEIAPDQLFYLNYQSSFK